MARTLREVIAAVPAERRAKIAAAHRQKLIAEQKKRQLEEAVGGPMQITLRYPTVTCPGCKRPMTPSPPVAVSDDTDLCDLTYACKKCGATTTRTIKIEK